MILGLILALVMPQAYHVQMTPRFESFGYTGQLKLVFSSDGYVNGTYRADTGGQLVPVRGGRQGKHIWLDIPTLGDIHVEGTMHGGGLKGIGVPRGAGNTQYIFTATPESSPPP